MAPTMIATVSPAESVTFLSVRNRNFSKLRRHVCQRWRRGETLLHPRAAISVPGPSPLERDGAHGAGTRNATNHNDCRGACLRIRLRPRGQPAADRLPAGWHPGRTLHVQLRGRSGAGQPEVGVILLLLAVGLHFSLADLMSVQATVLPGAIGRLTVSTLLSMALARSFGWAIDDGLLFGLALACGSTRRPHQIAAGAPLAGNRARGRRSPAVGFSCRPI